MNPNNDLWLKCRMKKSAKRHRTCFKSGMKNKLLIILVANLLLNQNLLAASGSAAGSDSNWAKDFIFGLAGVKSAPKPQISLQEKLCQPIEQYRKVESGEVSERNCSGTGQLASTVGKIQKEFNDPQFAFGCRSLTTKASELHRRLSQPGTTSVSLAQIHQEAAGLIFEISSKMNREDKEIDAAWDMIGGGSHFASGGLPCKQVRHGFVNHYDRVERKIEEVLIKLLQKTMTDAEKLVGTK